ncbi:DUF4832 domain-containing protein [Fulvivirgaceae bacterium BMA12]|uniref:DUF4832 domain-containing protein n=1 Tax=Agaribacillus aureus TaxID=3051825 RepID=A0ABT8L3G2_9BACT|nr:DUF4832 domain-containing protein [Fulvivirgaceae bacterium BMA12]
MSDIKIPPAITMKTLILTLSLLALVIASRGQVKSQWWDTIPQAEFQRIRPEYTDAFLNNPHKGTSTFQRFEGDPLYPDMRWDDSKGPTTFAPPAFPLQNEKYPPTRIAYCRWLWMILEPEQGKINYDIIDNALKAAAERGQTLRIRTQPYINEMLPDWYWKTGAKFDEAYFRENGMKVPDHNDPLYIKHWGNHIKALGARYDGHPNLESFDLAYGGNWGEGGGNATPETAAQLMEIYMNAFQKTQLLAMMDTDGGEYVAKKTDGTPIGWRVDCFGDLRRHKGVAPPELGLNWNHMQDFYPFQIVERGFTEHWKKAPVVMETCGTVAYWFEQGFDLDRIIEDGYKYHITSFMPKSVYIPEEWMEKILEFNKKMGYRFFIHNMLLPIRARTSETFEIKMVIDNRGVAPIYKNYQFALKFSQGNKAYIIPFRQDITKWLPGYNPFIEKLILPAALQPGIVDISCAIINEQQEAVVKLAIKAIDENHWHPLGVMEVVK